jgi:hypothetical protein
MARSCFILADYDAVTLYHLREPGPEVSRARTQRRLVRGDSRSGVTTTPGQVLQEGLRIEREVFKFDGVGSTGTTLRLVGVRHLFP